MEKLGQGIVRGRPKNPLRSAGLTVVSAVKNARKRRKNRMKNLKKIKVPRKKAENFIGSPRQKCSICAP